MKTNWTLAAMLLTALLPGCAESASTQDVAAGAAADASARVPGIERVVGEGITFPTAIASPRDGSGRMFVLERDGRIRILDREGKLLPEPYYSREATTDDIEQGLLGLAFDPAFADNGRIYIAYSGSTQGERYGMVLRRLQTRDPAANRFSGEDELLMRVEGLAANHNGGHIAFGPDGMLYWSVGAGPGDPQDHAHARQTDNLLGKIVRIDVRDGATGEKNACAQRGRAKYGVPADNPYAGQRGACGEIWLYGLRNPWRFGIDMANGDVWIGDVGKDREEISVWRAGDVRDLGFPRCQGRHDYPSTGATDCASRTQSLAPVYEYAGGDEGRCAVTGGLVYRGANPALKGRYVFSDSCSSELLVGRLEGNELKVRSFESGISPGYGTIASFGEDADNELWFVNHENGGVYRVK